ncbi:MAG: putative lipid II flippase FtsW [Nevskia sp.]|nr:putative lipid II flippase FtsW [Nevskia sp.]
MSAQGLSLSLPRARYGLDGTLCLAVAVLLGWGLVMVASASVAIGEKMSGSPLYFFERQLVFVAMGSVAGAIAFMVPMKSWESSGPLLLAFAFFLLVLVLIPHIGVRVNSARRWLDFGVFRLQASEPARLAMILYLAGYIVRRQQRLQTSLLGLAVPFLPLGLVSLLLLAEPDFGATAILMAVAMLMLFLGGARLSYLGGLFAVVGTVLTILVLTAAYRMKRLMTFTDPWADAEHAGWQLTQSLIAVGRGEWFGVGLGNSVQKLLYLPEMHTDFIFAILAEEFGLLGVAALLALFGVIVWRGFVIGQNAERLDCRFKAYLCYGLSSWLGLQAMINMAVNMGMLPTKGLTLPLVSYGGSSLITVCVVLALILRVDHENRLLEAGHPEASRTTAGIRASRGEPRLGWSKLKSLVGRDAGIRRRQS